MCLNLYKQLNKIYQKRERDEKAVWIEFVIIIFKRYKVKELRVAIPFLSFIEEEEGGGGYYIITQTFSFISSNDLLLIYGQKYLVKNKRKKNKNNIDNEKEMSSIFLTQWRNKYFTPRIYLLALKFGLIQERCPICSCFFGIWKKT